MTDPWRDTGLPATDRVADLLGRMTLREKLAQLAGVWLAPDVDGRPVAPLQDEFSGRPPWPQVAEHGLGQLTRTYGTAPVDPATGAALLAARQRDVVAASRFGVPALAHEECLTGVTTQGATVYPAPLAWAATFDPDLVREMAGRIGADLRALGVHQGLAPVLDVVRDPRWGRVEETAGEDPHLVGVIGAAYVAGLEGAGIVATLKHFVGYSASRAARNLAPVGIGPRELADVLLPPFEMALHAGARSVMNAYTELDGVPTAADPAVLTDLLRHRLGFEGTVVADYYSVGFLVALHGVAADEGDAAAQALAAGIDVELPTVRCYGEPLAARVEAGAVPVEAVDRAVARVLVQKCQLGLLDPGWSPALPPVADLDPPVNRAVARRLAEESVVLLANPAGVLPLREGARIAVVGPLADDPLGLLGCYSFPNHVGVHAADGTGRLGVDVPTVLDALRARFGPVPSAPGCEVRGGGRGGFAEAVALAAVADVCVVVLGDRPGLFGAGTSGEGCDAADLALPGVQADLLRAVVATGTPVVLVVCSGRPYAVPDPAALAALVQVFLPGEAGADALADVLTGRVEPSGRLPVSVPRSPAVVPGTYLTAPLGRRSAVTALDPTPLFPFGHGLSYSTVEYTDLVVDPTEVPVDGAVTVRCTVTCTGDRPAVEVVQLYLRDPVAEVTRPWRQLAGFARVPLAPGAGRTVEFLLHADRTAFTGRDGCRIVAPGEVEVHVGRSSADTPLSGAFTLVGTTREVGTDRVLDTPVVLGAPVRDRALRPTP